MIASCPLCWIIIDFINMASLPNNNAILHIIKLNEKMRRNNELNQTKIETLSTPRLITITFIAESF